MRTGSKRSWLLELTPFMLLLAGSVLSARFYDKDALIIFRFARNFAQHGALTFNLADPTYSLTSPAWGLIVGGVSAAFFVVEQARAVAIVLASACAFVFLGQVRRELSDFPTPWRAAALSIVALDPYLVWCAAVGNELPAFLVLLMMVLGAARGRAGGLRVGAMVGAAYLFRPEAVLLVPVIGVWTVLRVGRTGIGRAVQIALGAALVVLPWLILAQVYYGQFIPMTIEAKAEVSGSSWWRPLRFLVLTGGKVYALPLVALVTSLLLMRSRFEFVQRYSLEMLWVAAVVCFYVAGLREPIAANRYLVVFGPVLTLAALAAVRETMLLRTQRAMVVVAMVVWTGAAGGIALKAFESRVERMHAYEPYVEVCKWMEANLPEDARVFVSQLGAPGWYTDLHLVDNGIVSKEGLEFRRGEMTLEELWIQLRADFAVVTSSRAEEDGIYSLYRRGGGRGVVFEVVALSEEGAERVRLKE